MWYLDFEILAGGEGNYGAQPAYRDGNSFPVRPDKRTPRTSGGSKAGFTVFERPKTGEHEVEFEKIKNVFLAILRDIKKDMDSGKQPGEVATAAMLQTMRDTLAEQQQEPVTMDDVAGMVVDQLEQPVPMDEETAEQFRQLAKKMME